MLDEEIAARRARRFGGPGGAFRIADTPAVR
jgi:hypothetical protein